MKKKEDDWFPFVAIILIVLVAWCGFLTFRKAEINDILPITTTIRGQEIATKCDLKSYMGANGNEELLYRKLNALANYFKLEFVEKDETDHMFSGSVGGYTLYYKTYHMEKQRRKNRK